MFLWPLIYIFRYPFLGKGEEAGINPPCLDPWFSKCGPGTPWGEGSWDTFREPTKSKPFL